MRDRKYDAAIAKITAIASGRNRAAAGPVSAKIGRKTMQIESVETNAGIAICAAPSTIAGRSAFPCSRLRWMFSIATVASSTRMPTASARPPNVITLSVCPVPQRQMIDASTESGIETATTIVERQLPRKSRIISAVRQAAITPSRSTPAIVART